MVKHSSRRSASARHLVEDLKNDIGERVSATLAAGRESLDRWGSSARHQLDRADETVRANPYIAIGIAAGVGAVVGFLFGRRSGR
ncbi:MAG TPA: hypothetical protein VEB66_02640 [Opitutaceae bacterium]|nr:hypothetical protein [Opitutaceae bacterium]